MSLGKDGIVDIKIAANGVVALPDLGAFTLRGKTIEEAENELAARGLRKLKDFKARISLIQMRSINVFVLGEVNMPGNYTLSPMSGVMSAIYKAGGITDHSSLRNIKVMRGEKTISIDMYDYLLNGKKNNNDYSQNVFSFFACEKQLDFFHKIVYTYSTLLNIGKFYHLIVLKQYGT